MRVRKALWPAGVLAALGVLLAPMVSAPAQPAGAYDKLDNKALAEKLTALKMTELLEAMIASSPEGLDSSDLLIKSTRVKALATEDQAKRDALLRKVVALLDEHVKATAGKKDPATQVRHYRARLDRVIVLGVDLVDPYAERLLYFIGSDNDAAEIRGLTKDAVRELDRMIGRMGMLRDKWSPDWDRWMDQTLQKLEAMIEEAAYRGAWVRFYRAIVLAPKELERDQLLQQATFDVRKFADAEDNESGVKFQSLALSGMCARERGEWKEAGSFFRRAQDPAAPAGVKLKAMFETVRIYIDQKDLTGAEAQVKTFKADAAKIPGIMKVSIDMQAALLMYRIGTVRAEAFAKSDQAKFIELRGKAGRQLMDFVGKYPAYRQTFWEIIAPLVSETDPAKIDPTLLLGLGGREMAKNTPVGDKRAEEMFKTILKSDKTARSTKAGALWMLALLKNRQRKNLPAAEYFRRLAAEHRDDPNAKKAGLNAVKSFEAILKAASNRPDRPEARKGRPVRAVDMPGDFAARYARALEALVSGWGDTDLKIRTYNYELGLLYDDMDRYAKAISAFAKIPWSSELYLPAGFRIQQLRVKQLLDAGEMSQEARAATARSLITDLRRYMTRARQYLKDTTDASRTAEVRQWGADCGMLIAQLHKDILGDHRQAMAEAKQLGTDPDWRLAPNIKIDSERFVISVMLERGDVGKKVIDDLAGLVKTGAKDIEDLLGSAVSQIGERMERLTYDPTPDAQAKLKELRTNYKDFARKLYENVEARKDMTAEQKAPFKQALAHAYEFGSAAEVAKSLSLYNDLAKVRPNDADIIRGQARAYRVQGKAPKAMDKARKAMELYDRLRAGLPEQSAAWWRIELERLQYALELYNDPTNLKAISLHVKVLSKDGPKLGGYLRQFREVEGKALNRVKALVVGAGGTKTADASAGR